MLFVKRIDFSDPCTRRSRKRAPDHQIAAMSYHRINKKRGTIMKKHEKTCKFKISEIGTVGEALLAISSVVGGTNVSCLK